MHRRLFRLAGGALAACLVSLSAQAAGDPEAGQQIVMKGDGQGAPCVACHGLDGAGNDAGGFPRLAGMDADYLAHQIRSYNDGSRVSPIMQPNVTKLSEQQIQDVAAYYAGQEVVASTQPAEPDAAEMALGRKLVERGDWSAYIPSCDSCHGPGALGVGADFPMLAGQHPTYIAQQLRAWQAGTRHNDPNLLMTGVAERLSDAQIDAVAAYLSRLPVTVSGGQ
ncbi:c-type cytochrome [Granulosicoccaceae sp. 1_MG-2023]|nr:c-type cytochrome [Granulosicoccaceae sp. 1_MG-2023]